MSSLRKAVLLVLCLGIMIAAGWLGYFLYAKNNVQAAAQSKPAHTPQRVMVIHPQSATRTAPFVYNVRVKPIEEAEIFARADGFVEERLVDIGDTVKAGQLLARLSSPELEEGIKQVKADIKRQEAVAVLAKQQLKRAEALKDIGGVSRSEFDERTSDNHVAIATLATLKARLDQLQSEYGYTRIIAPFNGRITVRNIDRGDRVGSDDSTHARPLFRIVRDDTLRVIADVPQTQIYAIDTNGSAQFVLTEIPGKTFELVYDRSSHEVDPKLGSMRMEFLLDNRDGKLPSGLSGEIRIAPAKNATTLTVPDNTILMREGKSTVMTVDKQNRVAVRQVATGRYTSTVVEILSGLTTDDRVILNPNALIRPGDTVTAETPKSSHK